MIVGDPAPSDPTGRSRRKRLDHHDPELGKRGTAITPGVRISSAAADGVLRVRAEGELDVGTAPALDRALIEAEASAARTIVLDIEAVSFIDSTGLRALLAAQARSGRNGNRLRITRGGSQARRLFALVGVEARLPFVDP
ncbi:MAG: anti-sigma factor antagonist [Solirubrobacteraceae bacterium]|nr:anti-sigma factor antagonist [Solirubrobacteraceae bacterium]MEA2354862.1 anti-sigma factor antagonist [Solirubrobacteraceae bacterium]